MQKLEEPQQVDAGARVAILPVSVIVPVRNEAGNLGRCLESLREVGEVYVVDSQSSDETVEVARSFGATVIQFHYAGGWPKSGNGRWIRFRWHTIGFFWSMLTKRLRRSCRTRSGGGLKPGIDGYSIGLAGGRGSWRWRSHHAGNCTTRPAGRGLPRAASTPHGFITRRRCCPTARCWWRGRRSQRSLNNSAELYDPASGTWSATDSLNTERGPTATLLPNGKVLVAGGANGSGTLPARNWTM